MTDELCPDCNEPLEYDEVDIGVGVQRGNYGCPNCGWVPKPPLDCEDDYAKHKLTRQEQLEGLADRGVDTWEDFRSEK